MDYALLNFGVTILLLIVTFLFRKRVLAALGRLLFDGAVKYGKQAFLVEEVSEAEDGTKVARIGLSDHGKAIVAAVTPVLVQSALKSIKLKPGAIGASPLPEGLDLSNLSQALPAILPMLPKRYQGYAALLAPLLGKFLGGGGSGGSSGGGGGGWG